MYGARGLDADWKAQRGFRKAGFRTLQSPRRARRVASPG